MCRIPGRPRSRSWTLDGEISSDLISLTEQVARSCSSSLPRSRWFRSQDLKLSSLGPTLAILPRERNYFEKDDAASADKLFPDWQYPVSYEVKSDSVVLSLGENVAEVAFKGATLFSYKTSGTERLFKSSKSNIELSDPAAIRGGVPICWPVFGPPPAEKPFNKLKQHGFARTSQWTLDESSSGPVKEGGSAQLVFTLSSSDQIKQIYEHDFELIYKVIIRPSSELELNLIVKAPSSSNGLKFQALLHTYFHLPASIEPSHVRVTPLKGLKFIDKVTGGKEGQEDRDIVEVQGPKGEVDRVYHSAPNELELHYEGSKATVRVKKSNLDDVVLWNPGKEKGESIGDMETGGVAKYVCLEPGQVSSWVELEQGQEWTGAIEMKWTD